MASSTTITYSMYTTRYVAADADIYGIDDGIN